MNPGLENLSRFFRISTLEPKFAQRRADFSQPKEIAHIAREPLDETGLLANRLLVEPANLVNGGRDPARSGGL